jgi:hypothetical protein
MNRSSCAAISVSIFVAFRTVAFAQTVISAHSGLIHYVEGRVLLDGKPVEVKITNFPEVKENMELRTEDGRAGVAEPEFSCAWRRTARFEWSPTS